MPVRRRTLAVALLLLAAGAAPAIAQQRIVCLGHPIRAIRIYPRRGVTAPSGEPFAETLSPLFRRVSDALSWDTRAIAVRRELRIAPGEMCDLRRLAESERILRAQPYIRSATITTAPAPGDSIDVEVTTRDEWSLGGSVRFDTKSGKGIKAARLTEENLLGLGIYAQLRFDYFGRKAGFVAEVIQPEVFGHADVGYVAGHTSVGPVSEISLRRDFESEYDRYAWRVLARWRKEPFLLRSTQFGTVVVPQVNGGVDLGLLRRWGPPGRQLLLGASVGLERSFTTDDVLASLPQDDVAAQAAVVGRYTERRRLSVALLAGMRNIRFVPRVGIDAVHAREDVRMGFEIRAAGGAAFGYQMGLQEDRFALADLFLGAELGSTLVFLRSRGEGRWLPDVSQWENVLGSTEVYTYTSMGSRGSFVLGVEGAGGWRTTTPFQLLVAGPNALRGFGYGGHPAGRRVVVQAEQRYFVGTILGFADIGSAVFLDAGRGWRGDAVFGEDSGLLAALGAGVRIGFPSGSRFTTRVDFAVPVRGGGGGELRFTIRQQFGVTRDESSELDRSRQPIATIGLLNVTRN